MCFIGEPALCIRQYFGHETLIKFELDRFQLFLFVTTAFVIATDSNDGVLSLFFS